MPTCSWSDFAVDGTQGRVHLRIYEAIMAYERGEKVKDIALNWQTSERNVYKWLARWCIRDQARPGTGTPEYP